MEVVYGIYSYFCRRNNFFHISVYEQPKEENQNIVPDVEIFDADEKPVMLSSFFDKPLVLNFWATWSGTCKSEIPGF
ncbi:MAG: redoxin family protein, partial [Clostridia bacterium]|nr:redoxin family protein [Clostridia bacterium]